MSPYRFSRYKHKPSIIAFFRATFDSCKKLEEEKKKKKQRKSNGKLKEVSKYYFQQKFRVVSFWRDSFPEYTERCNVIVKLKRNI